MAKEKRDYQIDNIKGLLILLVVFGHSLELMRIQSNLANFIYIFIYTFHMPVFVFYSGYLSKNVSKVSQNAFRDLFIPFLLFNSLWNLIQVVFTSNVEIPIESPNLFSFLNPGWALWFIFALFIWRLLLPHLLKVKKIFAVTLFVGLLSRLFSEFNIFNSLSRILVFLPYFVGGFLISKKQLDRLRRVKMPFVLLIFIATAIFTYIYVFYTSFPTEFLWGDRSFAHFQVKIIPSLFFGIVLYVIGFSFNLIFLKIAPFTNNRLSKIGFNSLPVYILHTYIIGGVSYLLLNISNDFLSLLILAISSFLIAIILSTNTVTNKFTKILDYIDNFLFKNKDHS